MIPKKIHKADSGIFANFGLEKSSKKIEKSELSPEFSLLSVGLAKNGQNPGTNGWAPNFPNPASTDVPSEHHGSNFPKLQD